MSIFDMGKNLKFGDSSIDIPFSMFSGKLFETGKVNKNGDLIDPAAVFEGRFPKKRGRPKMEETFFYDPYETGEQFLVGMDTATTKVGDVVVFSTGRSGYVTKLIGSNTVKFNWQITYEK